MDLYCAFKEKRGDWYHYYYYPDENMDAPGEIAVTDSGEREVINVSKEDIKNIYAALAFRNLTNGALKPGTKEFQLCFVF